MVLGIAEGMSCVSHNPVLPKSAISSRFGKNYGDRTQTYVPLLLVVATITAAIFSVNTLKTRR